MLWSQNMAHSSFWAAPSAKMRNLPSPKPGHPRTPQFVPPNYQPKCIQFWIVARPEPHIGRWTAQNRRTYRILADGTLEIDECIAFWPMELPKMKNVPYFATTASLIHGTLRTRTIQNNTFLNGRPPANPNEPGHERKRTETNEKQTETNGNVRARSPSPQPKDWLKMSLQTLHPQGMSGKKYRRTSP